MSTQKKIIVLLLIILLVFLWLRLAQDEAPVAQMPEAEQQISLVATFYPLQYFAEAVGGERVSVSSMVPVGTEPHDYEPTPQDIVRLYEATVFLLNGAGVDAWAEKIRPDLLARGVTVLQMSEVMGTDFTDPHFWLDPVLAKKEVEAIRDVLVVRDPEYGETYTASARHTLRVLDELDQEYREGLKMCTLSTIVTAHDAFRYLGQRYGFEVIPVAGIDPEAEASPRALSEIAATVRRLGVRHIFFETLTSPQVAETLAQEVGAETLVLNPVEGLTESEQQAGKNYVSLMRENLSNLRTALQCQ